MVMGLTSYLDGDERDFKPDPNGWNSWSESAWVAWRQKLIQKCRKVQLPWLSMR